MWCNKQTNKQAIPNGNSRCTCADQLASCGRTVLLLPLEWRVSGVGVLVGLANRQASSIVPKRRGRCETTHRSCLLDVYATRDTREVAVQPRALECCGSWPRTGAWRRRPVGLAGGAWGESCCNRTNVSFDAKLRASRGLYPQQQLVMHVRGPPGLVRSHGAVIAIGMAGEWRWGAGWCREQAGELRCAETAWAM